MLKHILLLITICSYAYSGVMQITLNNIRNVLATYEQLHILFHNPQCIHSRKYVESFLKVESEEKLGLVDCLREMQLCAKYNFTLFPALAKVRVGDQVNVIDEQQFLVKNKLKDQISEQVLVNRFIKHVETQYAVVVFEDQGLPTIKTERISSTEEPIFYLQPHSIQNPSNMTKLLGGFVNNKQGCWIFKLSEKGHFIKYYCDSGYNKTVTKKYIQLFKQQKLKPYMFSQQVNEQNNFEVKTYNAQNMYEIIEKVEKKHTDVCTLIYFESNKCPSCAAKDVDNVYWVMKRLQAERHIQLARFSIDQNEIPSKMFDYGLKTVPELVYMCKNQVKTFGSVFFLEKIESFIKKVHFNQEEYTNSEQQEQSKPLPQDDTL